MVPDLLLLLARGRKGTVEGMAEGGGGGGKEGADNLQV